MSRIVRAGREDTADAVARWEGEGGAPRAAADRRPGLNRRPGQHGDSLSKRNTMIQTLAVVLIILWLLGTVTSYTMGGFIHILLVVAIVMVLVRLIQGRRLV
jgi:hypothetical protein